MKGYHSRLHWNHHRLKPNHQRMHSNEQIHSPRYQWIQRIPFHGNRQTKSPNRCFAPIIEYEVSICTSSDIIHEDLPSTVIICERNPPLHDCCAMSVGQFANDRSFINSNTVFELSTGKNLNTRHRKKYGFAAVCDLLDELGYSGYVSVFCYNVVVYVERVRKNSIPLRLLWVDSHGALDMWDPNSTVILWLRRACHWERKLLYPRRLWCTWRSGWMIYVLL